MRINPYGKKTGNIQFSPRELFTPLKARVPEGRTLLIPGNVTIQNSPSSWGTRDDDPQRSETRVQPFNVSSCSTTETGRSHPRQTGTQQSNAQEARAGGLGLLRRSSARARTEPLVGRGTVVGKGLSPRGAEKEREFPSRGRGHPGRGHPGRPPHLGLRASLLGHLEHELLEQLHGTLVHDGQRRALQLAAEVDVQVVQHLLGGAQRVAAQQRVADVAHGAAAAARGARSASGLPPRAPRARPSPPRQRGRDPASARRPRRPPARRSHSGLLRGPSPPPASGRPAVRLRRHRGQLEPDTAEPNGGRMRSAATAAHRGQAEAAARAGSREGATWRLGPPARREVRPAPQAPPPGPTAALVPGAERVHSGGAGLPPPPLNSHWPLRSLRPCAGREAPPASFARR